MLKKLAYENLSTILFERFPELIKNSSYHPEDAKLPYVAFGWFADMISESIIKNENPHLIEKSLSFIKELLDTEDQRISALISVEIFEKLHTKKATKEFAEKHFTGKTLALFKKMSTYVQPED